MFALVCFLAHASMDALTLLPIVKKGLTGMGKLDAHHVQFARYLLVGAAANATVLGIYWSLSLGAGLLPKLSLTVASAVGFVVTYTANRIWSFNHRGDRAASLVRYSISYFIIYCLQLLVLHLGSDVLGYPHQWVVVFGVAVAVPVSYALLTFFVFPSQIVVRSIHFKRADH